MNSSEQLKIKAKELFEKSLGIKYHYSSNKTANKLLKNIELEKGKLDLTSKKLAKEYAQDILGWKGFAPWLYVYTHMYGEFKEGWLPDNYFGKLVIPEIQGDYGKISFLKPFANKLFNSQVCPDLAHYINGQWFSSNYEIRTEKEINELIKRNRTYNNTKVISKLDYSYQGLGIHIYDKNNFNAQQVAKNGNGVIQPFIIQHEFFNQFCKDAVATLRLTTVIDTLGKASLRASLLRLGRTKQTHVQSSDQVLVAIDVTTGSLSEIGYSSSFKSMDAHPDSNTAFKDKTIPYYDNCVAKVLELQNKMPMIKLIGWDVVIDDKNEVVIMEWNGYGAGIAFSEATQGPSFNDLGWNDFFKNKNIKKRHNLKPA
ncbi:putative polysaccharide biosynthesis protein [Maribacter spongiicola]|uniref:Putative polysaccharide biosynthesis protein n=1 Tax=Maribacter spongiicola TaxID=1206753 RepID=A0A4R7K767_9FLAO|nr:sugar-transfer associated ATP-grasp domain-containing protein [Maribacter spongiicola]TDT46729.1 putative polysaccharide biosynthesis protein [Maribacter spongiicola]